MVVVGVALFDVDAVAVVVAVAMVVGAVAVGVGVLSPPNHRRPNDTSCIVLTFTPQPQAPLVRLLALRVHALMLEHIKRIKVSSTGIR